LQSSKWDWFSHYMQIVLHDLANGALCRTCNIGNTCTLVLYSASYLFQANNHRALIPPVDCILLDFYELIERAYFSYSFIYICIRTLFYTHKVIEFIFFLPQPKLIQNPIYRLESKYYVSRHILLYTLWMSSLPLYIRCLNLDLKEQYHVTDFYVQMPYIMFCYIYV
jgi:hypothetical protein